MDVSSLAVAASRAVQKGSSSSDVHHHLLRRCKSPVREAGDSLCSQARRVVRQDSFSVMVSSIPVSNLPTFNYSQRSSCNTRSLRLAGRHVDPADTIWLACSLPSGQQLANPHDSEETQETQSVGPVRSRSHRASNLSLRRQRCLTWPLVAQTR